MVQLREDGAPAGPGAGSVEQIIKALGRINPDISYGEWARVGYALKQHFWPGGEDLGLKLFDYWSAGNYWTGGKPESYSRKDVKSHWKSLRSDSGLTIATVFEMAGRAEQPGRPDRDARYSYVCDLMRYHGLAPPDRQTFENRTDATRDHVLGIMCRRECAMTMAGILRVTLPLYLNESTPWPGLDAIRHVVRELVIDGELAVQHQPDGEDLYTVTEKTQ